MGVPMWVHTRGVRETFDLRASLSSASGRPSAALHCPVPLRVACSAEQPSSRVQALHDEGNVSLGGQ